MQKRIDLFDGNIILIAINEGYCCNTVSISKGYLINGELEKTLNLSIWDDIAFHAYIEHDENNQIEFEFDMKDPMYFCLNRLLDNDNTFIIDDDNTAEKMLKYMKIIKENNTIKIIFINNNPSNEYDFYKYGAFIKNIGPDPRSKIHDDSTKLRIVKFFRDLEKNLLEDFHQITLDEHFEMQRAEETQYALKKNINDSKIKMR